MEQQLASADAMGPINRKMHDLRCLWPIAAKLRHTGERHAIMIDNDMLTTPVEENRGLAIASHHELTSLEID